MQIKYIQHILLEAINVLQGNVPYPKPDIWLLPFSLGEKEREKYINAGPVSLPELLKILPDLSQVYRLSMIVFLVFSDRKCWGGKVLVLGGLTKTSADHSH